MYQNISIMEKDARGYPDELTQWLIEDQGIIPLRRSRVFFGSAKEFFELVLTENDDEALVPDSVWTKANPHFTNPEKHGK